MTLEELLRAAPILADGAMGTVLLGRAGRPESVEALNLLAPDEVEAVHVDYVAAGADLLCTNTFAANRHRLARIAGGDAVERVNRAGAELARRATAGASRRIAIAGDVGPLGAHLAPYGRLRPEEARAAFAEQIGALLGAGVDLLVFETFADVRELAEALAAARDGRVPRVATMTFTRDDRTWLGERAGEVAARMIDAGADLIGVNCAAGPAQAMRLVREMRAAVPAARLAVKPNAGWPEQGVDGRLRYPATPSYFGEYARRFAQEGVVLIGGCCGTTAEHVAAMRTGLDAAAEVGAAAPVRSDTIVEPSNACTLESERGASPTLPRRLAEARLALTVEMAPPKGLNTGRLVAAAHRLREAGADAINVTDSPRARMRMSPWALCHRIQQEVGLETILHFPLRGRSVLRVQGDLLAAHALGIRNLFAVMGDPTAIGDHPGAMDSYDLVPSGLIRLVKTQLNRGVDHAGGEIGEGTSFVVGCAFNLAAADAERELRALRRKLEAGADFILTQPVFDAAAAQATLERWRVAYGPLPVPLVAGVLPLYGERHASFLHNEVPGICIPAEVRGRVARGGRDEGVRIALELVAALRSLVAGIYLMPPFSRWDMAGEIIEEVRRQDAL